MLQNSDKVSDVANYQLMFVETNTQSVSELKNDNDNSKSEHLSGFFFILQEHPSFLLKHHLNQKHIGDGSSTNA